MAGPSTFIPRAAIDGELPLRLLFHRAEIGEFCAKTCKAYFYPLVKAALGNDTAQTKADSIAFGTSTEAVSSVMSSVSMAIDPPANSSTDSAITSSANSLPEVAFINEYGAPKRGIAPRPAIAAANAKAEQAAADAGERVFNAYLDSKNL